MARGKEFNEQQILTLFEKNGPLTLAELAELGGFSYPSARRYVFPLVESGSLAVMKDWAGSSMQEVLKKKAAIRYMLNIELPPAESVFPQLMWPGLKKKMPISTWLVNIRGQRTKFPQMSISQRISKLPYLMFRVLNEVYKKNELGWEPNHDIVVSSRQEIADILKQLEDFCKLIKETINQPTLFDPEQFGNFKSDPLYKSELPGLLEAIEIITGEIPD
jgi:hypothetical protein